LVHCHIGSHPCLLLPGLLQCWSERSEQLCSKASWHHIFMSLSPNINQIVFRFTTILRYPRREYVTKPQDGCDRLPSMWWESHGNPGDWLKAWRISGWLPWVFGWKNPPPALGTTQLLVLETCWSIGRNKNFECCQFVNGI
jgi:hypothetical protein